MSLANTRQPGGSHYRGASYQHWDFVAECDLGYFEAQFTKYLCRHKAKNGLEDVRKVDHFAEKLAELAGNGYEPHNKKVTPSAIERFLKAYEIKSGSDEEAAIRRICYWRSVEDVLAAKKLVSFVIDAYILKVPVASDSEGGEAA
jgi:hypothetical protein